MSNRLDNFLAENPSVRQVEFVLVDPSGVARGKWAPVEALKKAFAEGVNFPLSLHGLDVWGNEVPETGLHIESGDLDGFCRAVPETLGAVPWGGEDEAVNAQVILQMIRPDGSPFGCCSRTILAAAVEKLSQAGLSATCAFELEFHLLSETSGEAGFEPAAFDDLPDAQSMYDLDALSEKSGFFVDLRKAAEWAQLPVDTIVKEAGPGQFEINLQHRADTMQAADDVVLLKRAIRECARSHGMIATFMAKPFTGQPGNGMHVHTSLLDGEGRNIFAGEDGKARQRHAVSGLLGSMAETALIFVNTVNGFRRMAPGSYAPTRTNWGENNRSVALRIPAAPEQAQRIEHRVAGADANPYLVLATILTAMREGLDDAAEPPAPLTGNAYDEATPNRGEPLPGDMEKALALFETSAFAARALGKPMASNLASIKRAELAGFANDISPMERRTYL